MKSEFLKTIISQTDDILKKSNNYPVLADILPALLRVQSNIINEIYHNAIKYENTVLNYNQKNYKRLNFVIGNYKKSIDDNLSISKSRIDQIRIITRQQITILSQNFTKNFFDLIEPISKMHSRINDNIYNDNIELQNKLTKIDKDLVLTRKKYQNEADNFSRLEISNSERDTASYQYKKQQILDDIDELNKLQQQEHILINQQKKDFFDRKISEDKRIKTQNIQSGTLLNEKIAAIYNCFGTEEIRITKSLDDQLKPLYLKQDDLTSSYNATQNHILKNHDYDLELNYQETLMINQVYIANTEVKKNNLKKELSKLTDKKNKRLLKKDFETYFLSSKQVFDDKIKLLQENKQKLIATHNDSLSQLLTTYLENIQHVEKSLFLHKRLNEIELEISNRQMSLAILPIEKKINELPITHQFDTSGIENRVSILIKELENKGASSQHQFNLNKTTQIWELEKLDEKITNSLKYNKSKMQLDIQKEALKRNFSYKFNQLSVQKAELMTKLKKTNYNLDLQKTTTTQNFLRKKLRLNHDFTSDKLEQTNAKKISRLNSRYSIVLEKTGFKIYFENLKFSMRENKFSLENGQKFINIIFGNILSNLAIFLPILSILEKHYIHNQSNNTTLQSLLTQLSEYLVSHYQRYYKLLIDFLSTTYLEIIETNWRLNYDNINNTFHENHEDTLKNFQKTKEEFEHNISLINRNITRVQDEMRENSVNLVMYKDQLDKDDELSIKERIDLYNSLTSTQLNIFRLELVEKELFANKLFITKNINDINKSIASVKKNVGVFTKNLDLMRNNEFIKIKKSNRDLITLINKTSLELNHLSYTFKSIISDLKPSQNPFENDKINDFVVHNQSLQKRFVKYHISTLDFLMKTYSQNQDANKKLLNHFKSNNEKIIVEYKFYYSNLDGNFTSLEKINDKRLKTVLLQTEIALGETLNLVDTTFENEITSINQMVNTINIELKSYESRLELELSLLLDNQNDAFMQLEFDELDNDSLLQTKFEEQLNYLKFQIRNLEDDYVLEKKMSIERDTQIRKRFERGILNIENIISLEQEKLKQEILSFENEQKNLLKKHPKDTN